MSISRILNSQGNLNTGIATPIPQYPLLNAALINLQNQINNIGPVDGALLAANNLSDVPNKATARTNLQLGSAAQSAATDFLATANTLSDVPNKATARTNLQLGSAAQSNAADFLATANNLSDLVDVSVARSNLALGSMAVASTADYCATANNLSDLADASIARSNLALGSMAVASTSDYCAKVDNLSGLADYSAARANLGVSDASNLTSGTLSAARFPAVAGPLALIGTTNNTNPSAGEVGEFLSAVMTRGGRTEVGAGDVINNTLVLTAGDWDVWGISYFEADGFSTVLTQITSALNTDGSVPPELSQRTLLNNPTLFAQGSIVLNPIRVRSGISETVRAWVLVTKSNATIIRASSSIYARRVR